MALTKHQRDTMPADDFAVPGKRALPIHDESHVRMAWDMVERTKGLSDAEKAEARRRIVNRAHKLSMDISKWRVQAMSWDMDFMSAMSLESPSTPDHPNKMPFSGCLVRLDEPSDSAPHGSFGMKTILTSAAAEAALPSILGMAIDYKPALNGHDRTAKIGIIDAATIETDSRGKYVKIGGFMYAQDFPEVTSRIQKDQEKLGFSFEAARLFVNEKEVNGCLEIQALTFTGAAVLMKNTAAYTSTSIAAEAEENTVMDEELKAALAGITASVTALGAKVEKIEASQTTIVEAASVIDKVSKHTAGLRKVAEGMAAAGIGGHATRGHVHILNHMADSMDAEACKGVMASSYSPPGMYASAAPGVDDATKTEIAGLKTGLEGIQNSIKTLMAAAAGDAIPAQRKTVEPAIIRLLAKTSLNVDASGGGEPFKVSAVDAALKGSTLTPEQRLQVKVGLNKAGLLAA